MYGVLLILLLLLLLLLLLVVVVVVTAVVSCCFRVVAVTVLIYKGLEIKTIPQPIFILRYEIPSFTPIKTTGKITVLYTFNLYF